MAAQSAKMLADMDAQLKDAIGEERKQLEQQRCEMEATQARAAKDAKREVELEKRAQRETIAQLEEQNKRMQDRKSGG